MVRNVFLFLTLLFSTAIYAQGSWLASPNEKIQVDLRSDENGAWYLEVGYLDNGVKQIVFPSVFLGLDRQDHIFKDHLALIETSPVKPVHEDYTVVHGKKKHCVNDGNDRVASFKNSKGGVLNVRVRAYNDGFCFRYEFPEKTAGRFVINDELTYFEIPETADRWLQRFIISYEGEFPHQKDQIQQGEWGYPALFQFNGQNCWALITEAGIDGTFCATKLNNKENANRYKLTFPAMTDGNGTGEVCPTVGMPWRSPWRMAIIGQLGDLVSSTLVDDVCEPSKLESTDWIKPGVASWIYWAYNHGTKDYKKVCAYIDLAVEMGWPYVLFDWEWDEMSNGGDLTKAVAYARNKGIEVWIWINSGGAHNRVSATPRDLLITHEARMKTFQWLSELGVCGVKVDFFESDKQDMMQYYIGILEDAAQYRLMVNFHGCTIPRGWTRTYPHLMSMEAVYGAEQYNNSPRMTEIAAQLNTVLPFTRNVVGPMDYTPVAFTDSQHPHTTSYAHELALSVVFESGITHMADRPEGFAALPAAAKEFLSHVSADWDNTTLLDGYPEKNIVIEREKNDTLYIAGLNGTDGSLTKTVHIDGFDQDKCYKMLLISDGADYDKMNVTYSLMKGNDITVTSLPRGGFAIRLTPFSDRDFTDLWNEADKECKLLEAKVNVLYKSDIDRLRLKMDRIKALDVSVALKFEYLALAYAEFCNGR